jgi:DNA ligase-1
MPEGLDGEIIVGPPNSEDVYGLTFKAVMSQDALSDFHIYVFDVCDDLVSYTSERLKRVASLAQGLPRIKLVEQTLIHTIIQLNEFYAQALDLGYEGVILRDPCGQYKYGRSTAKEQTQLKIKPEEDFEALVLSVYEGEHNANEAFTNEVGETKRSTHQCNKVPNGMLGGFHVSANGVEFNVAPGKMTHAERIEAWQNKERLPGRYIKYRVMTYGTMANGAARHGRWIGWRDKTDMENKDEIK